MNQGKSEARRSSLLSVVMPAFNEALTITRSIAETDSALTESGLPHEIIIVDDGSSDDTIARAMEVASRADNVRVLSNGVNSGKGAALRLGFRHCRGDRVLFFDADLDLHPRQIQVLTNIMRDTDADIVIGSKRHPASRLRYPKRRRFVSYMYNLLVRALFILSIKDTQTGIKLFRRSVLDDIVPRSTVKRFAFDAELLIIAHHLGYRIMDAPIELDFARSHRMGRMRAGDLLRTGWDTMGIFFKLYVLRHYLKEPRR